MRRSNAGLGGEEEENEINLTPMLDVVFIMLIFFVVTASFIKEAGIVITNERRYSSGRVVAIQGKAGP